MKTQTHIIVLLLSISCSSLYGQLSIDAPSTLYTENFNAYDGSTLSPTSTGIDSNSWAISGLNFGNVDFGGTGSGLSFQGVNTGAAGAGISAFETSTGDRALGARPAFTQFSILGFVIFESTTFLPGSFTLRLQNNTGFAIHSLDIAYDIFSYNNSNFSNTWNFSHSADNSTYTMVGSLDFVSTETASGSPAWDSVARDTDITGLSIANEDYYYLRWSTSDTAGGITGNRDQFALDNIAVSAEVIPEPETYALFVGVACLGLVVLRKKWAAIQAKRVS